MTKDTRNTIIGVAAVAGVAGLVGMGLKMRDMEKTINSYSDVIVKGMDVPSIIVDAAVTKATEKLAKNASDTALEYARNDLKCEIKNRVANAIQGELSNISIDVKDAISKKIAKIDLDDVKDEIIESITDRCEEKFSSTMNDYIDGYKEKLAYIMRLTEPTSIPIGKGGSKIELHF